ncbi:MAG: transposase [Lachnospiraceae bacterium]|nr:transposase [Lachnospiraceae bacterium]
MEKSKGFCTMTYCFRLYCTETAWLQETKKIYNEVLRFYYEILAKEPELRNQGKQQLLRELEIISVGTKEVRNTKYPVTFGKVPLYFRRAAINDAIRLYRSFESGQEHGTKQAKSFQASPVYYKGMYKEFTKESICLKLYDGHRWNWITCRVDTCGRDFAATERMLSPLLNIGERKTMLHVPVQETVEDVRTVKERLDAAEMICAVSFPGNDCMAVLVLLSSEGEFLESRFVRGGKELAHRRKRILKQIRKSRKCMGGDLKTLPQEENKVLKEKIHHLTDNAAHRVSREVVSFCKDKKVSIIVVPNYKNTLDLNKFGYLSATNYDWLGRRIISYIKYKAFSEGIVTTTVSTKNISSKCYQCGAIIKKYNGESQPGERYYGGKNFVCPNGHKGNTYFNAAMNIGLNFLRDKKIAGTEK